MDIKLAILIFDQPKSQSCKLQKKVQNWKIIKKKTFIDLELHFENGPKGAQKLAVELLYWQFSFPFLSLTWELKYVLNPSLNTQSCNRRPLCSTFRFEIWVLALQKPVFPLFWVQKIEKKNFLEKRYYVTFQCGRDSVFKKN